MREIAQVYATQATDRHFSEHWSGPPGMVDRLVEELGVRPSDLVLDVGCGVGGPARRLHRVVGCRVVGIDLLLPVVREARRRSREVGPAVGFVVGSAAALPLAAGSVDEVWSLGVVAHLDVRSFAQEAVRVLRAGGTLAVTEAFWDGRSPPRFEGSAPSPWQPLTVEAVRAALLDAGLEVEVRAWPGDGIPGALDVEDADLRADFADGRLEPALVIGRKAG